MSRAAALGTLVQRTGWGRRAVQRFVAGNTIEEAVVVALEAKRRGFTVTLDRLGEASTGPAADAYAADASRLLEAQAAAGLEPNVSVKLTAIGLSEGSALPLDALKRSLRLPSGSTDLFALMRSTGRALTRCTGSSLPHAPQGDPLGR